MRETLIYGLAFLLILGAGVFLILPRLQQGREVDAPRVDQPDEPAPTDAPPTEPDGSDEREVPGAVPTVDPGSLPEPATSMLPPAATALPGVLRVQVTGEDGALRGPLKPLMNVVMEERDVGDTPGHLRIRPIGAFVSFGALGHQWVRVAAADLVDGATIKLPTAAPAIVVRVLEADGTPAVDIPVRVRPSAEGVEWRTDAGGALVLDDLPPGNVLVDPTTRERSGPLVRLRAGVDREVELVLDPVWTVTGVVKAPGGRPVADARVEAFGGAGRLGRPTVTDAAGRFRWRGPVAGAAAFRVRHPDFAELAVETTPPAVGALSTDLGPLAFEGPGAAVDVTARRSIPGTHAEVRVEPAVAAVTRELFGGAQALDRPRSRHIGDGETIRFEGLPVGIPLRVSLRDAGVPVDAVVTLEAGETRAITLAPLAGHTVAALVRDPAGAPIAGARVLVSGLAREGDLRLPDDHEAYTGLGGGVEVFGVAGSTAFLRAYVDGYRPVLRRVALPLEAPLEIALEPAGTDEGERIQGRVRDDQGEPLAGVTVQAAGVRTQTDAEGRFRLDGVVTRQPVVRVAYGFEPGPVPDGAPHPKGYAGRAFADVVPGSDKELDLVLARAVPLTLTLADAIDDAPITFAHVLVRGSRGDVLIDRVMATRDGRLELPAVSPFNHARTHAPGATPRRPVRKGGLSVFACTHARRLTAEVLAEAGRGVDAGRVLMKRGMRIRGVVRTAGGRPLANARVAGMDAGWQSRGTDPEREREVLYRTARTDAEGRFELVGFNPRRGANIVAWFEDHAPVAANVLLPPFSDDVDAEIEIRLAVGSYLLLILEDAGTKRAIEGAMMDIEYAVDGEDYLDLIHFGAFAGPIGSTREWRAASELLLFGTQQRGSYRLGPLRPGPYELWLEHPGYESQRTRLTLPARGETFYDAVTYRHNRPERKFDRGTISFKGNTLRLIIPLEGR
ncbi:MAG: carboxypeptidase-like regulatory domain-containing protein [Planctomycetota bacterium]|nr:carboxypeptidase-like regulatory domain-containing protein [Planctomycetota bacterium]